MAIYITDSAGKRTKVAGLGLPGPTGKSAYQYAVEGGFSGTEDEFKSLLAGMSNPNLLDNWYFADPINQRGQTEYTDAGYTIDRWHKHSGTTLSIQNGFVRWQVNTVSFQVLIQVLEDTQLIGKEVTASYLVRTNNKDAYMFQIRTDHNVFCQAENEWTLVTVTGVVQENDFSISYGRPYVSIQVSSNAQPNDYIDIKAVKLELGSKQTLAHQDASGNWVLNDPPPNKALELLKCQRYYIRTRISRVLCTIIGTELGCTLMIAVKLPVAMRLNRPALIHCSLNNWVMHPGKPYDENIAVSQATVNTDGSCDIDGNIAFAIFLAEPLTNYTAGSTGMIASINLELSSEP